MAEPVKAGNKVRIYEEDDWFFEGTVICVDEQGFVTVDFDNWIERFEDTSLVEDWIHYQQIYLTTHRGVMVEDYRNKLVQG